MFGGLHLEEEEFEEVNTIDYSPCYDYIDIDHTRHWSSIGGDDKIEKVQDR